MTDRANADSESVFPATRKLTAESVDIPDRLLRIRRLRQMGVELTTSCNLACVYCHFAPLSRRGKDAEPELIERIVEFLGDDRHQVHYLRQPFQREPDFGVTSVNYDFGELLARIRMQGDRRRIGIEQRLARRRLEESHKEIAHLNARLEADNRGLETSLRRDRARLDAITVLGPDLNRIQDFDRLMDRILTEARRSCEA